MTNKPIDPVFDWGTVPLTPSQVQTLELYDAARSRSSCEVFCADCPARTTGRARRRCCQTPEELSRWQRLTARFR